jgi:hypothetical protein
MSEVGKAIGLAILIFGIISALGLLVWGWNLSSAFSRAIRGDSEATQDVGDLFKDYALGEVRDQIIGAVVGVVLVLAGIIGGFLAYSKR